MGKTGASKDLEIYENYAKETDLRLQTELLELLVDAGILEPRDLASPGFRPDLTCAIKKLNSMARTPEISDDDQEARIRRSRKAAMIEEQLIVAGYTSAIQARMCPDFRHLYRELRDGFLLAGKQGRMKSHGRDRNTLFSCVWTMTDARGRYCGGSLEREPSRICSRCGDKVLPAAARTHIRHTKTGFDHTAFSERFTVSCERQLSNTIIAVPRGLCASLVSMQEDCGDALAHRVSKWMLISFLDSASQRELLYTSSVVSRRPLIQKEEGGDSADHTEWSWVVPVLRFWNRDGLPVVDEQQRDDGPGIGGIDGAGSWSSSLALRPASTSMQLVQPVLTAMNNVRHENRGPSIPISALLSPRDGEDDGRSVNSAIWSQGEEEPRPLLAATWWKRAASPSPLFESTAGAKRVKT